MSAVVFARHAMTPAERVRDAGWVAFVGLILGIPLVGLTTVDVGGRLGVETRFGLLAAAVAAVFAGRLLLRWAIDQARNRKQDRDRASTATAADRASGALKLVNVLGWVALGTAVTLPILFSDNRYVVDTATTVLIYVMLGWGLNVVVGLAGLLDLGYVAFYAVGAYSYALLSTQFGWSFWEALPVSGALAASFGILLGYPILRLRGDYLAIVTMAFAEIIRVCFCNFSITGGGKTMSGILKLSTFPRVFWIMVVCVTIMYLFVRSKYGRTVQAIREDYIAASASGINVTYYKVMTFAISAFFAGIGGGIYAHYMTAMIPTNFNFNYSAELLSEVIIGGTGSLTGSIIGAAFLSALPELMREFSTYRMLAYSVVLVLVMLFRPGGIFGRWEFSLTRALEKLTGCGTVKAKAEKGA